MAAMIAGFEVDFTWLLQAVMHKRAFKATSTYLFLCIVFSLYRLAGVLVWHIDLLKTPPGTVDIGLICDEGNDLVPNRGPGPEVQPLGENLAATVEQSQ